ncbi:SDR family oxidoreductase [Leptolyngbya sp. AN02str]|uniref:SDR family oxidoreductase n=1 Tax=Leptolyngbya sp. AN02str TaxID=3423363 RepID=UPI003D31493E
MISEPTSRHIFLAGASRGLGREIAKALRARSLSVTALLRSPAAQADLEAMGIEVVFGDALNPAELANALQPKPNTTVISTIGGLPQAGQRADYLGNRNLVDAAIAAKAEQFILITSIGSGNSQGALAPHILEALGPVLVEKDKAEQHLIQSGLTYTIIRPGGLTSNPATGTGVLTPDPTISGSITRADVAELVCRCLEAPHTHQHIFSAVDSTTVPSDKAFEVVELPHP